MLYPGSVVPLAMFSIFPVGNFMKALVSCDTDNATGRSKFKTKSLIRNLTMQSMKAIKATPPGPVNV